MRLLFLPLTMLLTSMKYHMLNRVKPLTINLESHSIHEGYLSNCSRNTARFFWLAFPKIYCFFTTNLKLETVICDALRDLVAFVQFKNCEKHP